MASTVPKLKAQKESFGFGDFTKNTEGVHVLLKFGDFTKKYRGYTCASCFKVALEDTPRLDYTPHHIWGSCTGSCQSNKA